MTFSTRHVIVCHNIVRNHWLWTMSAMSIAYFCVSTKIWWAYTYSYIFFPPMAIIPTVCLQLWKFFLKRVTSSVKSSMHSFKLTQTNVAMQFRNCYYHQQLADSNADSCNCHHVDNSQRDHDILPMTPQLLPAYTNLAASFQLGLGHRWPVPPLLLQHKWDTGQK